MKNQNPVGGQGAIPRGTDETTVDDLDLAPRRDREFLSRGIASGWGLEPAKLQQYVRALDAALGMALKAQNARAITSCVRTMATLVGQMQTEEMKAVPGQSGISVTVTYID
jgi:hypothetical protein